MSRMSHKRRNCDSENRMTAFQGFGGAASYSYDGTECA